MSELDVFQENNFNHAVKVAQTLAKSSIVPMHFKNKPEDVFACLVLGAELGFKPMQALNSIVMIQGNATLKAVTMLAIARARVGDLSVKISEEENQVTVVIGRGGDTYTAVWNDKKADAMGLTGKDNYRKQKMTMYRWRAISEALKIVCSDVLMGLNAAEEMSDLEPTRLTMSQQLKKDVEEESPTPEYEKVSGPLFRFSNGKYIGKQLKDLSKEEIEAEYERLVGLKTKMAWQKDLCFILSDYLTNYEIHKETLLEMGAE